MDVDASVLNHHAFEHGADELLPGVEVERGERSADTVDKGLEVSLELRLLPGCLPLGLQYLDTAVDMSPPLPQSSLALPELIEIDESGLIGVKQAVFLAIQLGQVLPQRGQVVGQAVVSPDDSAWICRRAYPSRIKAGFSRWRRTSPHTSSSSSFARRFLCGQRPMALRATSTS